MPNLRADSQLQFSIFDKISQPTLKSPKHAGVVMNSFKGMTH